MPGVKTFIFCSWKSVVPFCTTPLVDSCDLLIFTLLSRFETPTDLELCTVALQGQNLGCSKTVLPWDGALSWLEQYLSHMGTGTVGMHYTHDVVMIMGALTTHAL